MREVLGRFAALEAALGGMIAGQLQDAKDWPAGSKTFNRRDMYAVLNWCTESHCRSSTRCASSAAADLPDAGRHQRDEGRRSCGRQFETYWQTPQLGAAERMKLYKLAWDLVGSEFAGRHLQYEKFYAGASFIIRNQFPRGPWEGFHKVVDDPMGSYGIPGR